MNMKNLISSILLLIAISISFGLKAQDSKTVSQAEKLFQVRKYEEALPLYKQIVESGEADAEMHYKLGKCHYGLEQIDTRVEGISGYEKALELGLDPIPYNFYKELADLYFADELLEKAIDAYSKQKDLYTSRERTQANETEQKIKQCFNALNYLKNPIELKIQRLGTNINTEYTEYNPVVSADESVMAFTGLRPNNTKTRSGDKFIEEIFISSNETGDWSSSTMVDLGTDNNIGTAGISSDGQQMMVFIGDQSAGSLYTIDKKSDTWTRPVSIGENVNSRYLETTASLTPDGKTIYFASSRPGGYGGLDIYKSDKKEDGSWGRAVNLGPVINSPHDEDAPFIHPAQTMLFFSSNRPEAIGGWDIFKTVLEEGEWIDPQNMGYPINTTANDNYFTLIADGSRGYFSSDRKGGAGGHDIYMMNMPDDFGTIPLTLIKGRILDAETEKPMSTKIYMVDNETDQKLDYVYHPNKETGDYLVILPPNKSYDMIIESEGFFAYTLNIDIPDQTYFYELYQMIYLKTITQFDVVVGQEVEVKNAFYNTNKDQKSDIRKEHEAALIQTDSIDAYELMGALMEAQDQAGIDYLLELIMLSDPIEDVNFDESNEKLQAAKRVYYYDESDTSKFEKKTIAGQEILSLPTMYVTKTAEEQKNQKKEEIKDYDPRLLEKVLKVYFDAGKSDLNDSYHKQLDALLSELKKHEGLGVEISGYASQEGDAAMNEQLSNKRAISVLDYINTRGIVRRRIVAKGYGATKDEQASPEESRRVEIRIVDLDEV